MLTWRISKAVFSASISAATCPVVAEASIRLHSLSGFLRAQRRARGRRVDQLPQRLVQGLIEAVDAAALAFGAHAR